MREIIDNIKSIGESPWPSQEVSLIKVIIIVAKTYFFEKTLVK